MEVGASAGSRRKSRRGPGPGRRSSACPRVADATRERRVARVSTASCRPSQRASRRPPRRRAPRGRRRALRARRPSPAQESSRGRLRPDVLQGDETRRQHPSSVPPCRLWPAAATRAPRLRRSTAQHGVRPAEPAKAAPTGPAGAWTTPAARVSGVHEDVPPRLRRFDVELSLGPRMSPTSGESSRTRKAWSRRAAPVAAPAR